VWTPEIAYRVRRRAKGLRPSLKGCLLMTAWKRKSLERIEGKEKRESETKGCCVVEVREDCQGNDNASEKSTERE